MATRRAVKPQEIAQVPLTESQGQICSTWERLQRSRDRSCREDQWLEHGSAPSSSVTEASISKCREEIEKAYGFSWKRGLVPLRGAIENLSHKIGVTTLQQKTRHRTHSLRIEAVKSVCRLSSRTVSARERIA